MNSPFPQRVALVHDWLTSMRGGEKCLEVLCELFPDAPIYTLFAFPDKISDTIRAHTIHTSYLQNFPAIEPWYRYYLPFFPSAIESFDLSGYECIISSSHAVAKGVKLRKDTLHISYVHTPMRYAWDMFDEYFSRLLYGRVRRAFIRLVTSYLRNWDVRTVGKVHHMIANSSFVRERIRRYYQTEPDVINPPVDVSRFIPTAENDGFFLVVSALVPYKRIDLAISACNDLHVPLRIIGDGTEKYRLRAIAGPDVRFDGWVDDAELEQSYSECRALLFPGLEDFGIAPVEAMAAGKPVIAYGRGGVLDSIVDGDSGVLFAEQTAESLKDAIRRFETMTFDASRIREGAVRFSRERYKKEMHEYIGARWRQWRNGTETHA